MSEPQVLSISAGATASVSTGRCLVTSQGNGETSPLPAIFSSGTGALGLQPLSGPSFSQMCPCAPGGRCRPELAEAANERGDSLSPS